MNEKAGGSVSDASESGIPVKAEHPGQLQHEVGGDVQAPLPTFSGRNEDWPMWTARFEAYAELVEWSGILDVAAAQVGLISMTGTQPETDRSGTVIYAVLLTKQRITSRGAGAETMETAACRILWRFWSEIGNTGTRKWCVCVNSGQRLQRQGKTS